MSNNSPVRFAFFGTDRFSVTVCDAMAEQGFVPSLVVSAPDRPVGRKLVMTPPPMALWAKEKNIPLLQPEKLDDAAVAAIKAEAEKLGDAFDAFVVASYGKIIPQSVLDIPKRGSLNVHPSLLPKYRGASPLEYVTLADDKDTGVTIIEMDAKMDHGPIAAVSKLPISEWPARPELEVQTARIGGGLVADVIESYVAGTLELREQDHAAATFTQKIAKADAQIELSDIEEKPRETFLKIQAYAGWPNVYFFIPSRTDASKQIRVIVKSAHFADEKCIVDTVVPEGSHEMSWEEFQRGYL
jgi:methionyl-tRNA formyltransferase